MSIRELCHALVFLCAVLCLVVTTGAETIDSVAANDAELEEARQWLRQNGKDPVTYVMDLFAEKDLVLLGEYHKIRHDLELVQDLIPAVHAVGVTRLVTEFARAADQPLIDSLLHGEEWDEQLARRITFLGEVLWAYQEYVDIYRAAWEHNRQLPDSVDRFRIIGGNGSPDWSMFKTQEDLRNDSLRRIALRDFSERKWAFRVINEVNAGHKVLSHSGINHAIGRHMLPILTGSGEFVRFEWDRMGHYAYRRLGNRLAVVCLHGPWLNPTDSGMVTVRPAGGRIDAILEGLPSDNLPIAFPTRNTPMGDIRLGQCDYSVGYDDPRLSEFCDGYVYTKPFAEYEVVAFIDSFYTEENIEEAARTCSSVFYRDKTAEDFRYYGKRHLEQLKKMLNDL